MATIYRTGHFFDGHLLESVTGEKWALYSSMAFKKGEKGYVIGTTNATTTAYGVSIPFDWELLHNNWMCFSIYADWTLGVTSANYWGILGTNATPRVWWSYQVTGTFANRYILGENGAVPITQSSVHPQPKKYNHHVFFVNYDTVNDILKTYIYQNGTLLEYIALPNGSTAKTFANAPKFLTFGYAAPLKNYSFIRIYTDVLESEIPSLAASEWKFAQGIRTNQKPVYLMYTQEQFNALLSGSPIIHEDFSNYTQSIAVSVNGDKKFLTGKESISANFNIVRESRKVGKGNIISNYPLGIDSNLDGLSDGWTKSNADITTTIVTGNGFTGNAQRFESASANRAINLTSIITTLLPNETWGNFIVKGKYRASTPISVPGYIGGTTLNLPTNTGDATQFEYHTSYNNQFAFTLPSAGWAELNEVEYIKLIDIPKNYYQKVTSVPQWPINNASGEFEMIGVGDFSLFFNYNSTGSYWVGFRFPTTPFETSNYQSQRRLFLRKGTGNGSLISGAADIIQNLGLMASISKIKVRNNRVTGEIKVWVDNELVFDVVDTTYNDARYMAYIGSYSGKLLELKYSKL